MTSHRLLKCRWPHWAEGAVLWMESGKEMCIAKKTLVDWVLHFSLPVLMESNSRGLIRVEQLHFGGAGSSLRDRIFMRIRQYHAIYSNDGCCPSRIWDGVVEGESFRPFGPVQTPLPPCWVSFRCVWMRLTAAETKAITLAGAQLGALTEDTTAPSGLPMPG